VLIFGGFTYSQVLVNGVDINKEDITYCELVGYSKLLSKKVTVAIDYGQPKKFLGKAQKITDEKGKAISFHGMIAALNFMEKNGWKYVNHYAIGEGGKYVYHFLLKRSPK
jgi:hypothetical protein